MGVCEGGVGVCERLYLYFGVRGSIIFVLCSIGCRVELDPMMQQVLPYLHGGRWWCGWWCVWWCVCGGVGGGACGGVGGGVGVTHSLLEGISLLYC